MTRLVPLLAATFLCFVAPPLAAQERAQAEKPGRYTMTPIDGGFLRLDTETGAISQCTRPKGADARTTAWNCVPVNDTARDEAARLRAENKKLEGEVRRLEEMVIGDPKAGPPPAPGAGPQAQLPSEQEIDRAIDELERLFRKYRDRLREFDRNLATPSNPGAVPKAAPPSDPAPAPKSL